MAVDPELTRLVVREELAAMQDLARTYGWDVAPDLAVPRVVVKMWAHNADVYIVEITLDNYKESPPVVEFIDPDNGTRGTPHAYPKGHDSFFNTTGPCICAPFNRKAYRDVGIGLHNDWTIGDWTTSKANGTDWSKLCHAGRNVRFDPNASKVDRNSIRAGSDDNSV